MAASKGTRLTHANKHSFGVAREMVVSKALRTSAIATAPIFNPEMQRWVPFARVAGRLDMFR